MSWELVKFGRDAIRTGEFNGNKRWAWIVGFIGANESALEPSASVSAKGKDIYLPNASGQPKQAWDRQSRAAEELGGCRTSAMIRIRTTWSVILGSDICK